MKIILEESQCLSLLRQRMTAKNAAADDADISLTGLPDLSPNRVKPTLSRSQSQRYQIDRSTLAVTPQTSLTKRSKLLEPAPDDDDTVVTRNSVANASMKGLGGSGGTDDDNNNSSEKSWQASLKKMLAIGQEPPDLALATKAATPLVSALRKSTLEALPGDAPGLRGSIDNLRLVTLSKCSSKMFATRANLLCMW